MKGEADRSRGFVLGGDTAERSSHSGSPAPGASGARLRLSALPLRVKDVVRAAVPFSLRHKVAKARLRLREPTGRLRTLPTALVIGAQRAGTSSLYRYLSGHPGVVPPLRKEVEYFSRNYGRAESWYRAHFTFAPSRRLSFEATPDYLLHPLVPERVADRLPEARFVVLLRDPVSRAYSHYCHMVRLGYETLPFEEAIEAESERIEPDLESLADDPLHDPKALLRFSYVSRGRYAEHLVRWFDHFPRDRFLVVRSEDLFADTPRWFGEITSFLDLDPWRPAAFGNVSRTAASPGPTAAPVEASTREELTRLFQEPNQALADLLGLPEPWWSSDALQRG